MPTLDWVEGFEHQVATALQFSGTGVGIVDAVSNPAGTSFPAGRLGGFALQLAEDGLTATNWRRELPATQQRVIAFWLFCSTPPTTNSFIFTFFDSGGSPMGNLRITTAGLISARAGVGTFDDGPQVANAAWHRVVIRLDSSGTTWVVTWEVDGVSQGTATEGSHVATDIIRVSFGSATASHNATFIVDDAVGSATSADYPIVEHAVRSSVPNADGTHNAGTNIIEDQTGADIGTAFSLLDEWPPNTTDYVRQNAAGASNYAEVHFTDRSSSAAILGVMAYMAGFASGTTAETGTPTTRIVDSGNNTLVDVYAGDMSENALHYRTMMVPAPAGGWDAGFDGVKARVGFRADAVGSHPRWSALMLQYAVSAAAVQTGAANVAGAGAVSATTTRLVLGAANVAGTGVVAATGNVPTPEPGLGVLLASNVGPASSTNLTASITSGSGSLSVTSNFATQARDNFTQPYVVMVDTEKILISSSTPTVLTVAAAGRGYDGTTPASHANGATVEFCYVVDRSCGLGYSVECEEDQINTDLGITGFRYGAHRRCYAQVSDPIPYNQDGVLGRMQRNFDAGRFQLMSMKMGSSTWAQAGAASPTVNVALYNQIVARGLEIAAWQASHAGLGRHGANLAIALHHEPNGDEATASISGSSVAATGRANWRAMYQNVFTIWFTTCGVTEWVGDLGGDTVTEGVMVAFNLVWGASSFPASMPDDWWPTSWTWGNQHVVMPAADGYNRGPNWRRFAYVMGATDIPGAIAGGRYKAWTDARRVVQAAAGRPLLQSVWETGCLEAHSGEFTNLATTDWNATGMAATKANWYIDFRNYVRDNWPELHSVAFFDSNVNSVAEWPHDTTEEAWAGWIGIVTDPVFSPEAPAQAPSATNVFALPYGAGTTFTAPSVALLAKPTLIKVTSAQADPSAIPTIANTHGTAWTQVATVQSNSTATRRRETVFVGYPSAATADIVVAFGGASQTGGAIHISQWDDAHPTNLVVQARTQVGLAFGNVTIPFLAGPQATSSVYTAAALNNSVGMSPSPGYVALGDSVWATPTSSALTSYIGSADDPADFTIDGTTAFQYAAIAIEIRAPSGAETFTGAAAVAGAGSILASGNVNPGGATIVTGAAAVAGSGDVVATGVLGLVGEPAVAGEGAIAVATTVRVKVGATAAAGAGAWSATGFVAGPAPPIQGSAQLAGTGAWVATGRVPVTHQASAMLGGAALWNATGERSVTASTVPGRITPMMGGPIPPAGPSW